MTRSLKRVLVVVSALCLLALPGAAAAASTKSAVSEKVIPDSQKEVVGGPDIGKVTISQDDEVLIVEAEGENFPFLSPGLSFFFLNTDGDSTTGPQLGADYILSFDHKSGQGQVVHWNGSDYVNAKKVRNPSRTLISSGSVGFMFNLANFGWPKHIDVGVVVVRGATVDSPLADFAPDGVPEGKLWPFEIRASMKDFDLTFAPPRPRAGAMFAALTPKLTLSDDSKVVPKTVTCAALLGGVRLPGLGRASSCRWRIPKGATGKRFVVTATVVYRDERAEFMPWKFRVG